MCSRRPRRSPTSYERRVFASGSTTGPSTGPGFKFNEWELKGVPLRIDLGGRDLAAAAVTVARRDTGEKQQIPLGRVGAAIDELLSDMQASLFRDRPRRTGAADAPRPRQLRRDDRVPPRGARVRRGTVVRQRRVRGARQGRELSDDPVPAARRAAGPARARVSAAAGRRRTRRSGRRRTSACPSS